MKRGLFFLAALLGAAGFVLPIAWPLGFLALALGILANDKQPRKTESIKPEKNCAKCRTRNREEDFLYLSCGGSI